jgi:hypothetical protein
MKTLKIRSGIKAGKLSSNHNHAVSGLRIKSHVRAGKLATNHNQTAR